MHFALSPQELYLQLTELLGVRHASEIDTRNCRFALQGSEFLLTAYGASGAESIGGTMRMTPVAADRESALIVFGMLANIELSAQLGFPAWFCISPGENALRLQFGTALHALTADRLAHMVHRAASLQPHVAAAAAAH